MENKKGLTLVKTEDKEYSVDSQGRKQGEYKRFTSLGNIYIKCNYIDNKLDGEYIRYYYDADIILYKCNYSKGLKEGKFICYYYYPSKRIEEEGNYVNGKKEGYWFEYKNEENAIPEIKYYKDAKKCDPPSIEVKNARKKI